MLSGSVPSRSLKHSSEISGHNDATTSHKFRFVSCMSKMRITTSLRCYIGLICSDCGCHLSTVIPLKPVWSDLSFVTWRTILLEAAIRRGVQCAQQQCLNNRWYCGVESVPRKPLDHQQQPDPLIKDRMDSYFHLCSILSLNVGAKI